jgi:steroid 5-alpha reductase family enzyme
MQAVIGFFGSIVALVATVVAAAAGITFLIVLWKSGALPEAVGWVTALIGGAFGAVGNFFGFLRELVNFARTG